jgi:hypothetical protein
MEPCSSRLCAEHMNELDGNAQFPPSARSTSRIRTIQQPLPLTGGVLIYAKPVLSRIIMRATVMLWNQPRTLVGTHGATTGSPRLPITF